MLLVLLIPFTSALTAIWIKNEFNWDWRSSLFRAVILTAAYGVFTVELFSLFALVQRWSVILIWILPGLVLTCLLIAKDKDKDLEYWPSVKFPQSFHDRGIVIGIGVILIISAIIAYSAPPNTYDSLTYHMSRVAHWAQHGGVRPFATGILRQNYMSPGAEMMVLQTYVLSQGDRWANAVQWFAMLISVIGVSSIARDLGAGRRGQLFAALFVASLPMGIAQASSTMTDYVTAMWVMLAASEVLAFDRGAKPTPALLFAAAAAGLAILAKPTGAVYIVPFALWGGIRLFQRKPLRSAAPTIGAALIIVVLLNLGYFLRNWVVFGNLLGGGAQLDLFTNEIINSRTLISNLLRNASLHAGTPWQGWNDTLYSAPGEGPLETGPGFNRSQNLDPPLLHDLALSGR